MHVNVISVGWVWIRCLMKRITTQERVPASTDNATKLPAKELLSHAQSDNPFEGGMTSAVVRYF